MKNVETAETLAGHAALQDGSTPEQRSLYRSALFLSLFTIFYNLIEGFVSVFFGAQDESLTLLGFGIDSFIEVISGIGILHMVMQLARHRYQESHRFERTALRITGTAFYILVIGLLATAAYNLITGVHPETTLPGVIISLLSLAVMFELRRRKRNVGTALKSDAILADAACTMTCIYMSVVLLAASALYQFLHVPYVDLIGSLGLAYFSFREGRECFEKARSKNPYACACED
jgi:divalent metal cation (Fe/Co/Zn/Cd) transporter